MEMTIGKIEFGPSMLAPKLVRSGDDFRTPEEKGAFLAGRRASAINAMTDYFHAKSAGNGWWPESARTNPLAVSNKLMLIVSEIAEAMEGDRKDAPDDKLPHRKMIEVELADALIRIFDLAGFLGLDLGGAMVEKDAYNDTRQDHKAEARAATNGKAY